MTIKNIKVGGLNYSIIYKSGLSGDSKVLYGLHDHSTATITINSDYPKQHGYTLLHELLHAVAKNQTLYLGDREEEMIESMTNGIIALFKQNPELIKLCLK